PAVIDMIDVERAVESFVECRHNLETNATWKRPRAIGPSSSDIARVAVRLIVIVRSLNPRLLNASIVSSIGLP
ncbi:hypothetical protein, partial [Mesorhizobium sp. M4A.F.Ca.ET.050.02.1.1]|uniref:hypothetical protein n=1 Tax=Mesorhizobium sp. M4A.F.Ca.ET.050.02.1.1 TaxID=2496754 RepID=UPI001AEC9A76